MSSISLLSTAWPCTSGTKSQTAFSRGQTTMCHLLYSCCSTSKTRRRDNQCLERVSGSITQEKAQTGTSRGTAAILEWFQRPEVRITWLTRLITCCLPHSLWTNDMQTLVEADELPQDVAGAEELLQRHSEHKTEIDSTKNSFSAFQKEGKRLISSNHYAKDEVLGIQHCK